MDFLNCMDFAGCHICFVPKWTCYSRAAAGPELPDQLEAQGLTYPLYVLISVVSCLTYAPLGNMVPAVGEEVGWRGFLYPQLKAIILFFKSLKPEE